MVSPVSESNLVFFLHVSRQPVTSNIRTWCHKHANASLLLDFVINKAHWPLALASDLLYRHRGSVSPAI